jgi:uncharacterized membrane protein
MTKLGFAAKLGWWVIAVLSVLVAVTALRFLFTGIAMGMPNMLTHFPDRAFSVYLHILASPVALFVGVFQFSPGLRARRPRLHRRMGQIYVVACALGAASGLNLALHVEAGPVAAAGFGLLAIIWFLVTVKAYAEARARRFEVHRRWMVRSFALSFAAVTLRLYLPVGMFVLGYDQTTAYIAIAWLCWIPNLLIAEWYLRRQPHSSSMAARDGVTPQISGA